MHNDRLLQLPAGLLVTLMDSRVLRTPKMMVAWRDPPWEICTRRPASPIRYGANEATKPQFLPGIAQVCVSAYIHFRELPRRPPSSRPLQPEQGGRFAPGVARLPLASPGNASCQPWRPFVHTAGQFPTPPQTRSSSHGRCSVCRCGFRVVSGCMYRRTPHITRAVQRTSTVFEAAKYCTQVLQ